MNTPQHRLYAHLDRDAHARLDHTAGLAVRNRPGPHGRIGAATVATQCLNTLRGDLCDGTIDPADVDWRTFATRPWQPRQMLHLSPQIEDLAVIAEILGVEVDRGFTNAIVGWAVERYLSEIDRALQAKAA